MRIAVIGLAGVGGVHVEKVSDMESAELACVCDIMPDTAQQTGEKYGVKAYISAEEMFEKEELEGGTGRCDSRHAAQISLSIDQNSG